MLPILLDENNNRILPNDLSYHSTKAQLAVKQVNFML